MTLESELCPMLILISSIKKKRKKERKEKKKKYHWSLGEIACKGRVFLQKHYCTVFRNMDFGVKEDWAGILS